MKSALERLVEYADFVSMEGLICVCEKCGDESSNDDFDFIPDLRQAVKDYRNSLIK